MDTPTPIRNSPPRRQKSTWVCRFLLPAHAYREKQDAFVEEGHAFSLETYVSLAKQRASGLQKRFFALQELAFLEELHAYSSKGRFYPEKKRSRQGAGAL